MSPTTSVVYITTLILKDESLVTFKSVEMTYFSTVGP